MGRDIVVIGGSAGALQPVAQIVRGLPSTLPAALFVALHTSPETPGMLPQLLANGSTMSAGYAVDGEPIRCGHVFVARPDHHLLLEKGRVRIARGPRENGFRPAIDPLFRTAAEHYGPRVVGIILSGGLDDGANGLGAVKRRGGIAIVQHLDEAFVRSMPLAAMRSVEVDHVVPAAEMVGILVRLAEEASQEERTAVAPTKRDVPDRDQGLVSIALGYSERAAEIERRADLVRGVLVDQPEPMRQAAELTRETNELVAATVLAEDTIGSRKRRGRSR